MIAPNPLKRVIAQFSIARLLQKFRHFPEAPPRPADPVDADEPFSMPAVDLPGVWEVVGHLLRPGAVVLNVAAESGVDTRRLSHLVGVAGQVFALEPNRLADPKPECLPNVDSIADPLASRSLDALFAPHRPAIDFVRCELPNQTLACLRSAGELLRRVKPAWLLRVEGDPEDRAHAAHAIFHLMQFRGYVPYCWTPEGLGRRRDGERSDTYLFLTLRHVGRIPLRLMRLDDGPATIPPVEPRLAA